MRIIAIIIIKFILLTLIGCQSARLGQSEVAYLIEKHGSFPTYAYWHTTTRGCLVADENNFRDSTYRWTGRCLNGYVSGEGTLWVNEGKTFQVTYRGSFENGKKIGEFSKQYSDKDSKPDYISYDSNGFGENITLQKEREAEKLVRATEANLERLRKQDADKEKETENIKIKIIQSSKMLELNTLNNEMRQEQQNGEQISTLLSTGGDVLIWPTEGGLEQWGFSRPSDCAPGYDYILPLLKKIDEKYMQETWFMKKPPPSDYFESEQARNFRRQSDVLLRIQKELIDVQKQIKINYNIAKDYLKIQSNSNRTPADVINELRSFNVVLHCNKLKENMLSSSEALQCGIALRMLGVTDKLENFIQQACRLNIPAPKYAGTSQPKVVLKREAPVQQNSSPPQQRLTNPRPNSNKCSNGALKEKDSVCTAR
jgi:hypothetical protein